MCLRVRGTFRVRLTSGQGGWLWIWTLVHWYSLAAAPVYLLVIYASSMENWQSTTHVWSSASSNFLMCLPSCYPEADWQSPDLSRRALQPTNKVLVQGPEQDTVNMSVCFWQTLLATALLRCSVLLCVCVCGLWYRWLVGGVQDEGPQVCSESIGAASSAVLLGCCAVLILNHWSRRQRETMMTEENTFNILMSTFSP